MQDVTAAFVSSFKVGGVALNHRDNGVPLAFFDDGKERFLWGFVDEIAHNGSHGDGGEGE